jgi:hypothetical protein
MNYSNVLFLITDKLRAIRVSYEDGAKNHTIKKTFDPLVKVNDFVIVETNTRHNMTVCKVVAVDVEVDFNSDEQLGWIIARVDMEEFDRIKKQEMDAVSIIKEAEKAEQKQELRRKVMNIAGASLNALTVGEHIKPTAE